MQTPWGAAQTIVTIADGIQQVTTASHGGILLNAARTAAMPPYMAGATFSGIRSAYEEDSDWCMPVLVFEAEFRAFFVNQARPNVEAIFDSAKSTLRNSHPNAYETFYGIKLNPGESYNRDQDLFHEENKANWIAIAAWGDWKNDVPKGMVGVCAKIGGHRGAQPAQERYFLVPAKEYPGAYRFGFVIDLDRHQEIAPLA